jgi:serine/threonine protein kinase
VKTEDISFSSLFSSVTGEEASEQLFGGQQQQQQLPEPPVLSWPDPAAVATAAAAHIHTAIGTPFYTAPEVYSTAAATAGYDASGGSGSTNRRSYNASVDVFALGVVVVELLLGIQCLWKYGPPKSLEQAQQWEQRLGEFVDGELQLPEGVVVSAAARQFVGCCCGVGKDRAAAAARGAPKRLTPVQLKEAAWLQQQQQ